MRSTERHAHHVAEQVRFAGADPVGPDDLPPMPTAAIDQATATARRECDAREESARVAMHEMDRSFAHRDQTCATATSAVETLGELLSEVERLTSRCAGLTEELPVQEEAAATARSAADIAAGVVSAFEGLDRALERVCGTVPLVGDTSPELMSSLEGLESMVSDLCVVQPELIATGPLDAGALSRWRSALARGSAPLVPDADAILAELEAIEAEWTVCGAGDVSQDPLVVAARNHETECRDAVADVREHAATGSVGHDARVAIEVAHDRRVEVEARGRKVDPDDLELAVRGEHDALARVGFDSMLDFQIVMSGAGVGSLTAKRRRVVADELAASTAKVERVQAARAVHHRDLREHRAAVRGGAALELGLDEMQSIRVQLRRQLVVPAEVDELRQEWHRRAVGAAEAFHDATAAAEAATAAATECAGRVRHAEDELETLIQQVPPTQERVAQLTEAGTSAERAVLVATTDHEEATTAVDAARARISELHDAAPLDVDVAAHLDSVEQIIVQRIERARGSGASAALVLDDPLAHLPVEETVSLLDRLGQMATDAEVDAGARPDVDPSTDHDTDADGPGTRFDIVLVTSRRELIHALRGSRAHVRTVDSRRRHPRFGRRRAVAAGSPSAG